MNAAGFEILENGTTRLRHRDGHIVWSTDPTEQPAACDDHWPTVVIGPGGYPFVRCYRCPAVIPRDEAPRPLLLDAAAIMRGEPCRSVEPDELETDL